MVQGAQVVLQLHLALGLPAGRSLLGHPFPPWGPEVLAFRPDPEVPGSHLVLIALEDRGRLFARACHAVQGDLKVDGPGEKATLDEVPEKS